VTTPAASVLPGVAAGPRRLNRSVGPVAAAPRFTLDGGDALEARLGEVCRQVLAGVRGLIPPDRLEAVLLGGGYGRGEGGVLTTPEGERPYNDLEFYVCVRGNRHLNERRHRLPLAVLGELLTPMAGVEIEFKLISLEELRRSPVSMFSYDLVMGHRWLLGHGGLLFGFTAHRLAAAIPAAEATRLLLNRGSGLLFARERLERAAFTPDDADFVQRNLAKAELALGDAVLAAHGQYHWSCGERHQRLLGLEPDGAPSWKEEVRARHATAVAFKLHPWRSPAARADLQAAHAPLAALAEKVWLWQEQRRLGLRFATIQDYIASRADKCPETSRPRNVLVNLKLGTWFRADPGCHPRDGVLRDLSRLLWDPAPPAPAGPPFSQRVAAYRARWQRVN